MGGNQVRFKSKKCKRDKNLIAFTNFPYTLFACRDESFIIRRGPVPFKGGRGGGSELRYFWRSAGGGCGESEINNPWSKAGEGGHIFLGI